MVKRNKKNRSRADILADILEIVANENSPGIGVTKLMFSCFLSHHQLHIYLDILTTAGLLKYDKFDRFYRITPKGRRFMTIVDEMRRLLEPHPNEDPLKMQKWREWM